LIYFFNFDSWVVMFLFVFGTVNAFHRGLRQDCRTRNIMIQVLSLLLVIAAIILLWL